MYHLCSIETTTTNRTICQYVYSVVHEVLCVLILTRELTAPPDPKAAGPDGHDDDMMNSTV